MEILKKIKSPDDLQNLNNFEDLASEIRDKIIEVVSCNGGHLASNLGVVELTIAILKVFGGIENNIIWDVGHQCYAYKMLTGRFSNIDSLRKNCGLSGFSCRGESQYDHFTTGHSSNSISVALGIARSKKILRQYGKAIAIIGDGAMTGGLAFEGLNNAGKSDENLLVILNDNDMSISKNVGAIAKYFNHIRTQPIYLNTKRAAKEILYRNSTLGKKLKYFLSKLKILIKSAVIHESTIFENLGFAYYGPINGHNVSELINVFSVIKDMPKPILVHVITKKGSGYEFAEKNPDIFHAVTKFNIKTGEITASEKNFSKVFGETIVEIAKQNSKIFAITAAMPDGVGLSKFSKIFPDRFVDVGIAEAHATTFAAGLAIGGILPVFSVYSSFLQRAFDQIIHDVAMQRIKVIFSVDRSGLVGSDGESHQGIFDVPFLCTIPGIEIYSPSYFFELEHVLKESINSQNSTVIRYPKGAEFFKPNWLNQNFCDFDIYIQNKDNLIITYGRIFSFSAQILDKFPNKISIMKLNKISPLSQEAIENAIKFKNIFFFEESIKSGGIGEKFGFELLKLGFSGHFVLTALDDFIKNCEVEEQLEFFSLDFKGMINKIGL
ncbi:MAG: 1-deoxy-D-xylulose-5-phosphate synthase [Oscillospiraceae bacterium]|jgi:1-deoxy-D-xylulose-5-phosphate synthase|nr:1-deoxy-D-xylulose-5-phosphate synthase [Oscillospiraceae bacterium]